MGRPTDIPGRRPELPGGFALIDFLLARAAEAGERPPACALDWQDVEIMQFRQWGRTEEAARRWGAELERRGRELAAECRVAARRWSDHPDFNAGWHGP
jgi:hypothetical protein